MIFVGDFSWCVVSNDSLLGESSVFIGIPETTVNAIQVIFVIQAGLHRTLGN